MEALTRVRRARAQDCEAIAAIYNEGIAERTSTFETEPRSAADIARWLDPPHLPVLIAERAGVVYVPTVTGKLVVDNEASRRLTARHGFREVGTHVRHGRLDGRWHDVLLSSCSWARPLTGSAAVAGAAQPPRGRLGVPDPYSY